MYLIWYGIGRFALEFIRIDTRMFANTPIPTAAIVALGLAAFGAFLVFRSRIAFDDI